MKLEGLSDVPHDLGDKMAYDLGPSAEEFIARLRENKLYSRF